MGRGKYFNACNIDGKHFTRMPAGRGGSHQRTNHLKMHVKEGKIEFSEHERVHDITARNMRKYLHVCNLTEEECKIRHVAKGIFPRDC